MEIGSKAIMAGAGLFLLGGLTVYLLTSSKPEVAEGKPTHHHQEIVQAAANQTEQQSAGNTGSSSGMTPSAESSDTPEMTHAAFLAEAEARRTQNMENKAEMERLEKLLRMKQNSNECKFWKQQQSSATDPDKIEDKITKYCTLQNLSSTSNSETTSSETQL